MDVIDRLIAAVKASDKKRWHIAADAGMSSAKLSKIMQRKQVPTVPEFIAIAAAINLDPAKLFTSREFVVELESLQSLHALTLRHAADAEHIHERVKKLLPLQEALAAPAVAPRIERSREALPVRAAADPNVEMLVERETVQQRIPDRAWNLGARIVVRVAGDSMDGGADPIRDGELAYLKPTRSARNVLGEVALVRWEDGLYLKSFEMSGHTIRLVSANPASETITIGPEDGEVQVFGYVVGHAFE
jgi:SOS-response transcriptional repressor LexA